MPYIVDKNNRRKKLRTFVIAQNAGELNYQIFSYVKSCGDNSICYAQIKNYINDFLGNNPNYQKYNDMTGVLIRCYKEIIRRLGFNLPMLIDIMNSYDEEIANYENLKIKINGDIE